MLQTFQTRPHPLRVLLVDQTEDFATLKRWQAKGWRITHCNGDVYAATKFIHPAAEQLQ